MPGIFGRVKFLDIHCFHNLKKTIFGGYDFTYSKEETRTGEVDMHKVTSYGSDLDLSGPGQFCMNPAF